MTRWKTHCTRPWTGSAAADAECALCGWPWGEHDTLGAGGLRPPARLTLAPDAVVLTDCDDGDACTEEGEAP